MVTESLRDDAPASQARRTIGRQKCPNLTFGCYAQSSVCGDVGTCVDANLGG